MDRRKMMAQNELRKILSAVAKIELTIQKRQIPVQKYNCRQRKLMRKCDRCKLVDWDV
jgi:hypothetical protein